MDRNDILVYYGDRPQLMAKALLERADLASLIPKGARIGLKPNLVVARPASEGATTHPDLVAGVIEYLQEHGHTNLLILEGSWVGDSTRNAFQVCGYESLSKKYRVPLLDTKSDRYVTKSYGGLDIQISKTALSLDFLISLPVLKGHCQTQVTGALKNLKGILSDKEKRHFHALGLHKPIAILNKIRHADFVVVDGICGDLDFEDGGNPVPMNRIFCGTDSVLIDSYIASCMGYAPEDIEYIRLAAQLGVGSMDLEHANIIECNRDQRPVRAVSSRKVQALARYVNAQDACSACYANLIQALARLKDEGLLSRFEKNAICIGQKYQGQHLSCPGIGNCTRRFSSHVQGCPPQTRDILSYLEDIAAHL